MEKKSHVFGIYFLILLLRQVSPIPQVETQFDMYFVSTYRNRATIMYLQTFALIREKINPHSTELFSSDLTFLVLFYVISFFLFSLERKFCRVATLFFIVSIK